MSGDPQIGLEADLNVVVYLNIYNAGVLNERVFMVTDSCGVFRMGGICYLPGACSENAEIKNGAPSRNRTDTPLRERDFESRASTSSATGALPSIISRILAWSTALAGNLATCI